MSQILLYLADNPMMVLIRNGQDLTRMAAITMPVATMKEDVFLWPSLFIRSMLAAVLRRKGELYRIVLT